MTDPIRRALLAAIEEARPGTLPYWAERLAFTAATEIARELRWLDIYENSFPSPPAERSSECP